MAKIKYYPLSRVLTDQSTTGNMFTLDNKPYLGPYYITYDGKAFSGPTPASGQNELLTPVGESLNEAEFLGPSDTRRIRTNKAVKTQQTVLDAFTPKPDALYDTLITLQEIVPYNPIVTSTDYARGYFTRYFAKKVNVRGYVLEISYDNWAMVTNNSDNTYEDYEVIDMLWQLKGPLHDTRVSQYQVTGGVYDTNKRVTEGKNKNFNGLVDFIGDDYIKFARIT